MVRLEKYNTDTTIFTALRTAGSSTIKANPTLSAGDVKISKDGGAFTNLVTLPDVLPLSGTQVRVRLSASEMNCKYATIVFSDVTGAEWEDNAIEIQTYGNVSASVVFDMSQSTPSVNVVNSVSVSAVSAIVSANVVQISDDSSAADNLELQFDGTGLTSATFPARQDQLSNIVATGASVNQVAESFVLTTGSQTGSFSATFARDGSIHQLSDTAGTLDCYYQFDIGQTGVPASVQLFIANVGTNDTINFSGWNWATSAWIQVGNKAGTAGITYSSQTFPLYTSMVGTGANQGKVRIRINGTGLSTSITYVDQIFVAYAIVNQSVGYAQGAVWIDTINGTAGTTSYVNGTADKPVLSFANAVTIANTLNLHKFMIIAGSTITLVNNHDYDSFEGAGGQWNLNLGNQSIAGAYFANANVSGTATAISQPTFKDCAILDGTSLPPCYFDHCGFSTGSSAFVGNANGQYLLTDCMSLVAGSGTPSFSFSAVSASTGINIRRWSGGTNITLNSNCTLSIEVVTGGGQTVDCGGASSVEIRGICRAITVTGITSASTVQTACVTGLCSFAGVGGTVRVYGVVGSVTDSRTGSPTFSNLAVSQGTIWAYSSRTMTSFGTLPFDVADAVWDESRSTHTSAGTFGQGVASVQNVVSANVVQLNGNTSASNNLELQFNGTGLQGSSYPARQDQISNIASVGAATNQVAESFTITSGSVVTGTYITTIPRDGVYHQIADVGGNLDCYYQFDLGGRGTPTSISIYGGMTGNNDVTNVYGWNWSTSAWIQVGSITGLTNLTPAMNTFSLYTNMVGTGANLGKVRVRFANTGLTTANLYIDQLYASYATIESSIGYQDGAVWVDTINGTAGTTLFVNGTADKPVNSLADGLTIANALGVRKFNLAPESNITLTQAFNNWIFQGKANIDLNGQMISDAIFVNSESVSGSCDGSTHVDFYESKIGNITIGSSHFHDCLLQGNITLTSGSMYTFTRCVDEMPQGLVAPTILFASGASVGLRDYRGGIQVNNMNSSNEIKVDGAGRLVILSGCTGGGIVIRGFYTYTDQVVGGFLGTITDTARFAEDQSLANITGNVSGSVNNVVQPIAVSGGTVTSVTNAVNATVINAVSVSGGTVNTVTNDVGITQVGADKVWNSTSRSLTDKSNFSISGGTVTTNLDKTNYTVSGGTVDNVTNPVTGSLGGAVYVSGGTVNNVTGQVSVSGGTVDNVTNPVTASFSGAVYVSGGTVNNVTGQVSVSGGTVNTVTNDVGVTQVGADKVWNSTSRSLTDKVNFSISGGTVNNVTTPVSANVINAVSVSGGTIDTVIGRVGGISAGGISASSFVAGAIDATAIAANAIGASEFAQGAADKIWSTTSRSLTDKVNFSISGGTVNNVTTPVSANVINAVSVSGGTVNTVTNDVGITQVGADKVWNTTSRSLTDKANFSISGGTITTNLDKTNYSVSGGNVNAIVINAVSVSGGTVDNVTNDVGITQVGADKVWSTSSRSLTDKVNFSISGGTVTTNLDKTNYTVSGGNVNVTNQVSVSGGTVDNVTNDVGITQVGADKVWNSTSRSLTDKVNFSISGGTITTNLDKLDYTVSGGNVNATVINAVSVSGGTVDNVTNDVGITQVGADKVWNSTSRSLTDKVNFSISGGTVTTNLDKTNYTVSGGNVNATVINAVSVSGGTVNNVTSVVSADMVKIYGVTSAAEALSQFDTFALGYVPGAETNLVSIVVENDVAQRVPNVNVVVYNASNEIVRTLVTGSNGDAFIRIDDGFYVIAFNKSNSSFADVSATISADTNIYVSGSSIVPVPPLVGAQTLYGYVAHGDTSKGQYATVVANLEEIGDIVQGQAITTKKITATVDANGYFEMQLIKGGIFTITETWNGKSFFVKCITITNDNTKDIATYERNLDH